MTEPYRHRPFEERSLAQQTQHEIIGRLARSGLHINTGAEALRKVATVPSKKFAIIVSASHSSPPETIEDALVNTGGFLAFATKHGLSTDVLH